MAHPIRNAPSTTRFRTIVAVAASVAVVGLGWTAGLASAAQVDTYPAPGGASRVSTAACAHTMTTDFYPAPGGASGVSTLPCAHAGA